MTYWTFNIMNTKWIFFIVLFAICFHHFIDMFNPIRIILTIYNMTSK